MDPSHNTNNNTKQFPKKSKISKNNNSINKKPNAINSNNNNNISTPNKLLNSNFNTIESNSEFINRIQNDEGGILECPSLNDQDITTINSNNISNGKKSNLHSIITEDSIHDNYISNNIFKKQFKAASKNDMHNLNTGTNNNIDINNQSNSHNNILNLRNLINNNHSSNTNNPNNKTRNLSLNQSNQVNPHKINSTNLLNLNSAILKRGLKKHDNFSTKKRVRSIIQQEIHDPTTSQLGFLDNIYDHENKPENEFETMECFIKLKVEEFNTTLFTILSIGSSLVYHDLNNYGGDFIKNPELLNKFIIGSIIICSVCNILFLVSMFFRYTLLINFQRSGGNASLADNILSRKYIGYFISEIILAIIHPNLGFHYLKHTTDNNWYLEVLKYNINDFIILLSFLRIYVLFRFLIVMSNYFSAKALRVSKMVGKGLDHTFAIKCLIKVKPYMFVCILGVLSVAGLSFMLRIIEGPVFNKKFEDGVDTSNIIDFRSMNNCIWVVCVTMTTVGYGDFYPYTNLGRLIALITAIIGNIVMSLMIVSLQNSLLFNSN